MSNQKMPALFIGHGSPMNALEKNKFSLNWERAAKRIPKPKSILCISAHWIKEGTAVTAMPKPKTIHDFYGFPEPLYKMKYSAKGSTKLAKEIKESVKTVEVASDHEWGLDHGTWSFLVHMYPKADIPVLQLSLDYQLPLKKIFKVGKELSELRKKGVLIVGSGNLVHNLMMMNYSGKPFSWAVNFDKIVKNNLDKKDYEKLINYTEYPQSTLAHPTNDHYLPLLYVIGAAEGENPQFFNEDVVYSSVGMRCVAFGARSLGLK